MVKNRFILIILTIALCTLSATPTEGVNLLLLSSEIATANHNELVGRLTHLSLSREGDTEQLRQRLYTYYNISPIEEFKESSHDYQVEILNGQRLHVGGESNQFIFLEGGAQIGLTKKGEETATEIGANAIVVNLTEEYLIALSDVSYLKGDDEVEDSLSSEILTVQWGEGSLRLTKGSLEMVRDNKDGEPITFFTTGEEIYLSPSPRTISFEKGVITTNKEQAYFSIAAKRLFLIDGGDFFVTNATFKLGRVPVLWTPAFYYPGRTFIFNPALGYDSDRGFFFATTTELFGKTPKIESGEESSFTLLLASGEKQDQGREGLVYSGTAGKELSSLEKWARSSDSYLSLLFDGYQNRGVMVGLDSVINTTNKVFRFTNFGAIAFVGDIRDEFSTSYYIPPFRYAYIGDWEVKTKAVNLTLKLPYYSDPRFMRDYGNRLTTFSLGALWGESTFPTIYNSDLTTFTWKLDGSANIPVTLLNPYIKSLKIERLSSTISWRVNPAAMEGGYHVEEVELPNFSASLSGTLLSLKGRKVTTSAPKEKVEIVLNPAIKLRDWGIEDPYSVTSSVSGVRRSKIDNSSLNLDYSFKQTYNRALTYKGEDIDTTSHYARTSANVTLKGALAPSIGELTQKFDPLITVTKTDKRESEQISITSTTDVKLLPIGLSYGLTLRLYNRLVTDGVEEPWELAWSSTVVSRHELSWSWPIAVGQGVITPSLTATLSPLPYSFNPKLAYALGRFAVSGSYLIKEDSAGKFQSDKATLAFVFNEPKYLIANATFNYATDEIEESEEWWHPLELSTSISAPLFKGYLTLSEKSVFSFESLSFDEFQVGAALPWASISLQGSGYDIDLLDASIKVDKFKKLWWKNRISLGFEMETTLRYSLWDQANSAFAFKLKFNFSIAQFLTIDLAFKTINKGFHRYENFKDLWEDLLRSFDFAGDGRRNTQFTMEAIEFNLIHHMADWDLHCKYEGSIVLSDMEWRWHPVFSIYLNWKAIPEIEVDREFILAN